MKLLKSDDRDLSEGIKWQMILRIVVVTFMLGFTVLLQIREGTEFFSTPLRSLYFITGLFYLLTIAYSVAFHLGAAGPRFAFLQVGVDLVLISCIVLVTGAVESLFSIAYFLVIIGASILLYRRGSILAAGMSTLLYSAAVCAPFSRSMAALVDYQHNYLSVSMTYVGYRIILNTFGFFLVALLSSHLAESLRRAGEELSAKSSHLAELERRSENILQNITSGLITTDLSGRINYVNRAAERITQIDSGSVLGRNFMDIFQIKGDWDPFENLLQIENLSCRLEGWVRDRAEEQFLGMTISLLREEGASVSGTICSFQDMTRVRKMEEQIRRSDRLAVVGELAAGMAHEIRNPLASLSGSIQLLSEELTLEDTNRELMNIVTREVSRLNTLITDFLLFANPRPPQLKIADLSVMLRETSTLLQRSVDSRIQVKVVAQSGQDFRAEVDPTLTKQVFWNLARNAIEAMPDGGSLTMTIKRQPLEVEASDFVDHIAITFEDTGIGIHHEEIEKIFTPFRSNKEHGTGLGLAIVFRIIEAHRGRIEVESRPGEGTTFAVHLPVRQGVVKLAPLSMEETA